MKTGIALLLAFLSISCFAQDTKSTKLKYRRSSLYTLMVTDKDRKYENIIQKAFLEFPVPEKFNDHNLPVRTIVSIANIPNRQRYIDSMIDAQQFAKKMVAKWFNRSAKGTFNMDLVAQRGEYNASEIDASIARKTKRGLNILADAGAELIDHTFLLVNDLRFISKKELSKKIDEGMQQTEKLKASAQTMARVLKVPVPDELPIPKEELVALKDITAQGYVVVATSYLYRLDWNDSVAAIFYNDLWTGNATDKKRRQAFDSSDIFRLAYIGAATAWVDVEATVFGKRSEEELVRIATVNVLDAVIARLQRKHEAFRTTTPISGTEPLMARIGMKEGLQPGDKFSVLEQVIDEEGRTSYREVGIVKAGKQVWDNRFMATGDLSQANGTQFTVIKGKKFYNGMLIKQVGRPGFSRRNFKL